MSTKEQEEIIKALRDKTVKIEFSEIPGTVSKIDKTEIWLKAKLAGETIDDDDLPAGNPATA